MPTITFKETLTSDDITMEVLPDEASPFIGDDDEAREQFEQGLLSFVGVRAIAKVHTRAGVSMCASTAGLWGIGVAGGPEDEAYLKQVFEEERATLLEELQRMGILPKPEEV